MKPSDYLRLIGGSVLGGAVLIAALIPVQSCGTLLGDRTCFEVSFYRAVTGGITAGGIDYRWPIRIGIVLAGVVVALLMFLRADEADRRPTG